jgi:hypothetical protein
MALILDGNGLIQGLDAGGLPSGSVNADSLASTLDLSSKTMTFGNVSASGITFPASVSASGNANTLDDYEEGDWTPTLTGSSSNPTGTYNTQAGGYIKIGRLVYVYWRVVFNSGYSAGSGDFRLSGLPFTSTAEQMSGNFSLEVYNANDTQTNPVVRAPNNVTYLNIVESVDNSAWGSYNWSNFNTGATMYFFGSITYLST